MMLSNCTNNHNDIVLGITLLLTLIIKVQCGLSIICLIPLMVHTLVKPLIGENKKKHFNIILFI